MPDASPPPNQQFWLLTGEVPTGPFSVDQIHAKIANGDATWQTPACPVGGGNWLPLVRTPGIGPSAPPRPVADTRLPDAHSPSTPVASAPSADAPAGAENHEASLAATSPASTNRSTPTPDTTSSAPAVAPIIAPQEFPPQASAGSLQPTAEPHRNSPSRPNQPNQFWLLVGTKTIGPFRTAHIRGMLQSGELAPDAKARRVGTEIWVSLTEAVGALPPRPTAGPKPPPLPFTPSPPVPPPAAPAAPVAPPADSPSTAWGVTKQHADDVRNKAFWTAIIVTLVLAPSPTLLTKLLGEPKAGLEEFITIGNVLWHTLPLTLAAAIDAGILMVYAKHPALYPKTEKQQVTLWCCLGGVLVGSMLLGGWLGKVETSEWSQAQLDDVKAGQKAIDPSGQTTKHISRGLAQNATRNKAVLPIAIALSAAASLANYFTLYGPAMFFSSVIVGVFLGWVWAIKLPAVVESIEKSG